VTYSPASEAIPRPLLVGRTRKGATSPSRYPAGDPRLLLCPPSPRPCLPMSACMSRSPSGCASPRFFPLRLALRKTISLANRVPTADTNNPRCAVFRALVQLSPLHLPLCAFEHLTFAEVLMQLIVAEPSIIPTQLAIVRVFQFNTIDIH